MALKKIISGGQTGADQGGLLAAALFNGIETGGWIPRGFLTEYGPAPWLADLGLVETKSNKYQPRTYTNARDGDGTIRFATDWDSRGEICTLNAILQYNRPYFDVDVRNPLPPEDAAKWIEENKIEVLNVAGNRETTSPGIQEFVKDYMTQVLLKLGHELK
jgi:hypothetical protein